MTLIHGDDERMLPAKQARSRETRDRLLAAGRQLLEQGAFEATSIADIAAEAGCSVGAFYHRFADKEAFFTVLIEMAIGEVVAEAKATLTPERLSDVTPQDAVAVCVAFWIERYRRNRGLLRTVMKKTLHSNDAWTPLWRLGAEVIDHMVMLLATKCGKQDSRLFYYRASAGFQIVSSMAMNATLHETRMLTIDGSELVPWAAETLRHCVFDDIPAELCVGSPPVFSDKPGRKA